LSVAPWRWHFQEQYGFILEDIEPMPFVPSKGALGLYPVAADPWPEVPPEREAAVSLIIRGDMRILCVWNPRYEGWSLPGGMVEPGETAAGAQERELREETGCTTVHAELLYRGPHGLTPKPGRERPGRASIVNVFSVAHDGTPRETEKG